MALERIDPLRAKIPLPSQELIDAMVVDGQKAVVGILETLGRPTDARLSEDELPLWWDAVARAMYGTVAKHGGAKVTKLKGGV